MAGAVAERAAKPGKKGLRRPKRRISIRIDMTPMVDIAFLLLIFYMVSTVFAMPQAMEINLPPADLDEPVEIKESNLLTVRVDSEGRFWWNMKAATPENLPLLLPTHPETPDTVVYEFNADTLRGLLLKLNRENSSLSTLVLIHRKASYKDMVNILDEIDVIERSWNKYMMDSLGVKKISELTKEQKFSYRYAIGDWAPRDDKILDAALRQAMEEGEL